jgi:hypothetical protein
MTLFTIQYQRRDGCWAEIDHFTPSSREMAEEYAEYLRGFSNTQYRVSCTVTDPIVEMLIEQYEEP